VTRAELYRAALEAVLAANLDGELDGIVRQLARLLAVAAEDERLEHETSER
jgi:hypothetical protein